MTSQVHVENGSKIQVTVSVCGPFGPGGIAPGRTLFVAHSWPSGADVATCFTDVPAALAAAAALPPPPDVNNPAAILLYPGLYPQPVNLISNVHLLGVAPKGCAITGAVTYTPGVGVNASQASLFERVYISRFGISGAVSIDCTGKPLGQGTTFDIRDVDISANVTHRGRAPSGQDNFQSWVGVMGGSAWSFDACVPFFNNGVQLGAATVTLSNCAFGAGFAGCLCFSALNVINTASVTGSGNKFANVNVDANSSFGPVPGSKTGVVTVAAGGLADLRGAEYLTLSNLAGAGSIDRNLWRRSFGPTVVGANVVTLAPAYLDANYSVQLTQTAGVAAFVTVSGKQAGQFTLNDSVGGNTFDVTIVKE